MMKKLRHLTIASLVSRNKNISYELLLKELSLHNVRELEVRLLMISNHLSATVFTSVTPIAGLVDTVLLSSGRPTASE